MADRIGPMEQWDRHEQGRQDTGASIPNERPAVGFSDMDLPLFETPWVFPANAAARRSSLLARTIEESIVPRLVLSRRSATERRLVGGTRSLGDADVDRLLELVLEQDEDVATAFLNDVGDAGAQVESIYLDLLAPTARRLGTMWDEDLCDFTQVTLALVQLQRIMRQFSAPLRDAPGVRAHGRHVLLVPAPGDQHSFGLAMVSAFFQRAGWHGWSGVPENGADILRMVREVHYDIVGFSVSNVRRVDALALAIRGIRRVSRNPDIGVMVGGPLFNEHPELVGHVGADATASDGRQAVLQAKYLLTLTQARNS